MGIEIAGFEAFGSEASDAGSLADRVARSGADGVYIAGLGSAGGVEVLQSLRARIGDRIEIMAHDPWFPIPDLLEFAGPSLRGVFLSATDVPPTAPERSPEGRRFARDFGALESPVFGLLPAAQVTDLVLDAIARLRGTRASALEKPRGAKVRGRRPRRFPRRPPWGHHAGSAWDLPSDRRDPAGESVFEGWEGTVLDRVITVPARLAG